MTKYPSGIEGLDQITHGGLPAGRVTALFGGPGSGKTLFLTWVLAQGARTGDGKGVLISFEESAEEIIENAVGQITDLRTLVEDGAILIDHVYWDTEEDQITGRFTLDGILLRIEDALEQTGATRIGLDSLESLLERFGDTGRVRTELSHLLRWLKARGLTVITTAEMGEYGRTRYGVVEYLADTLIFLDSRVNNQISTRRIRVQKYRGSSHQGDEHPFLITDHGLSVLPVSSAQMDYPVSDVRISTGTDDLDALLGGKGFFQGSSILLAGTPGTGKTSLATSFAAAACRRGERCLYVSFEESLAQVSRNMQSIGLELAQWSENGLLRFHAERPSFRGLEDHLLTFHDLVDEVDPQVMVIDPLTSFGKVGSEISVQSLLTRLIDYLKTRGITSLFTSLVDPGEVVFASGISSLMDAVVILEDGYDGKVRRRDIRILKSRGMTHSEDRRGIRFTDHGIEIGERQSV